MYVLGMTFCILSSRPLTSKLLRWFVNLEKYHFVLPKAEILQAVFQVGTVSDWQK